MTYNKENETLIAEGNVLVFDLINNIKISSDKIDYNKIYNHFFQRIKHYLMWKMTIR